jgi:hypothetical protein
MKIVKNQLIFFPDRGKVASCYCSVSIISSSTENRKRGNERKIFRIEVMATNSLVIYNLHFKITHQQINQQSHHPGGVLNDHFDAFYQLYCQDVNVV